MIELTEADRKAIDERAKYEWPSMQAMFKHGAEWGIKHARANDDPGPEWVASNILEGAAKRIKELEAEVAKYRNYITEERVISQRFTDKLDAHDQLVKSREAWRQYWFIKPLSDSTFIDEMAGLKDDNDRLHSLSLELHDKIRAIESEVATQRERKCDSEAMDALLAYYCERIKELEHQLETLQKENEGWDQQAQDRELFEQWKAIRSPSFSEGDSSPKIMNSTMLSPSSAKDTPDKKSLQETISEEVIERLLKERQSSPVSVDINQDLVLAFERILDRSEHLLKFSQNQGWDAAELHCKFIILEAKAALSKASPPKQSDDEGPIPEDYYLAP